MQIITVILILLFVPVSAKAMNSGAGNLDDAITTLASYNVDTHFDDCGSDADYNGYYDTDDNYILICNSRDADTMRRTFQHEVIHVLQDCKAGLNNADFLPLLDQGTILHLSSKEVQQFVANSYDEDVWHVELEANSYDTNEWTFTNMTLAQAIRNYCL